MEDHPKPTVLTEKQEKELKAMCQTDQSLMARQLRDGVSFEEAKAKVSEWALIMM